MQRTSKRGKVTASVVSPPLTEQEIAEATVASQLLGASAKAKIGVQQFVVFMAFDGTNNNKYKVPASELQTNVAQLFDQCESLKPNLKRYYYAGVGTGGMTGGFGASATTPTPYVEATAQVAYGHFVTEALNWLAAEPGRSVADVGAAITGFSRGAGTAIAFARLLNDRGLGPGVDGQRAGEAEVPRVVATLLLDPVFTCIELDLDLPPNVSDNVVVVKALDEFRFQFEAADFGDDPRVRTIEFRGNHGNIGGCYDNGIGALVLAGATAFFNESGVALQAVPQKRTFGHGADNIGDVVIYSEAVDSYGNPKWSEGRNFGVRLTAGVRNAPHGTARSQESTSAGGHMPFDAQARYRL
jgi:hypothetical protein